MSVNKLISTSAIAKSMGIAGKELFEHLSNIGLVIKTDGNWVLTEQGKMNGGDYKESKQYGKYVVWPVDIEFNINDKAPKASKESLITSSVIGKYFQLTANKTNYIISELGWIEKGIKGWTITKQGEKQGGLQSEDFRSGVPYVKWPESILKNKSLNETIEHLKGDFKAPEKQEGNKKDFREKFEAKHRATDGHFVRSRAEMLIDNWLYMAEIVHAYERKLPIEEDVYSDFYIPTGKVYIEFWGLENDPKYRERKEKTSLKVESFRLGEWK